jgi:Ni/Fe-hydrogenase 1 B-type cytochrome subunit
MAKEANDANDVKRVRVWSGWLRLAHWSLAGATLALLATGWVIARVDELRAAATDYHYWAAAVLIAGLALRLGLLAFGRGPAADLPKLRGQWPAILQTLKFYASFGRSSLPAWYAHNPLWQPIYLGLLVVLLLLSLSGLMLGTGASFAGRGMEEWHDALAGVAGWICALHLLAVFLHDLKGSGSDASAMISGHRIFVVPPVPPVQPGHDGREPGVQAVSIDSLRASARRPRQC